MHAAALSISNWDGISEGLREGDSRSHCHRVHEGQDTCACSKRHMKTFRFENDSLAHRAFYAVNLFVFSEKCCAHALVVVFNGEGSIFLSSFVGGDVSQRHRVDQRVFVSVHYVWCHHVGDCVVTRETRVVSFCHSKVFAEHTKVAIVVLKDLSLPRGCQEDRVCVSIDRVCLLVDLNNLFDTARNVPLKDSDSELVHNHTRVHRVVVAAIVWFVVVLETVAPEKELANVTANIVIHHELATWMLTHELCNIQNKIVQEDKFSSSFQFLSELFSAH